MAESYKRESGEEWPFIGIVDATDEGEAVRRISTIGDDVRVAVVKIASANPGNGEGLIGAVKDLAVPAILVLAVEKDEIPLTVVKAFDLCFAADTTAISMENAAIPAREAERRGLINHCGPADEVESQAMKCAGAIARLAPLAVKSAKRAVREGGTDSLEKGLALENILFAKLFSTGDMREGTNAFLEKRPPVFRGE